MQDLRFVGVTDAHDGFLDRIGGIFTDIDPGLRRDQNGDPPRLPELERALPARVHERLFDRSRIGRVSQQNLGQQSMQ